MASSSVAARRWPAVLALASLGNNETDAAHVFGVLAVVLPSFGGSLRRLIISVTTQRQYALNTLSHALGTGLQDLTIYPVDLDEPIDINTTLQACSAASSSLRHLRLHSVDFSDDILALGTWPSLRAVHFNQVGRADVALRSIVASSLNLAVVSIRDALPSDSDEVLEVLGAAVPVVPRLRGLSLEIFGYDEDVQEQMSAVAETLYAAGGRLRFVAASPAMLPRAGTCPSLHRLDILSAEEHAPLASVHLINILRLVHETPALHALHFNALPHDPTLHGGLAVRRSRA